MRIHALHTYVHIYARSRWKPCSPAHVRAGWWKLEVPNVHEMKGRGRDFSFHWDFNFSTIPRMSLTHTHKNTHDILRTASCQPAIRSFHSLQHQRSGQTAPCVRPSTQGVHELYRCFGDGGLHRGLVDTVWEKPRISPFHCSPNWFWFRWGAYHQEFPRKFPFADNSSCTA